MQREISETVTEKGVESDQDHAWRSLGLSHKTNEPLLASMTSHSCNSTFLFARKLKV